MSVPRDEQILRILFVEDDRETRQLVAAALREQGYEVTAVDRGAAATSEVRSQRFSAVLLDVRLPDSDGIALCREWRSAGFDVPILILTARTDVSSRVAGLDAGADDYLGKPFAVAELKARLRSVLRRGTTPARARVFRFGELSMSFSRRQVRRGETEVPLTRRELELLERLVQARGHAVSREDLMEDVWGDATPEAAASLEVIIGRLRRKLDAAGSERLIRTFRGYGYSFVAAEEERQR